jgi:hypothetical protein
MHHSLIPFDWPQHRALSVQKAYLVSYLFESQPIPFHTCRLSHSTFSCSSLP